MKVLVLTVFMITLPFLSSEIMAQSSTDSIRVTYVSEESRHGTTPLYYLNGVLAGKLLSIFNPAYMKSVEIKKETKFGEIYITTDNLDSIVFLTPEQIKKKYATKASNLALYFLDGAIIKDLDLKIEEAFILSVNVDTTEQANLNLGKQKLSIINIKTRSKENVAEASVIKIRGLAK